MGAAGRRGRWHCWLQNSGRAELAGRTDKVGGGARE
jgi:hypothetical protein